MKSSGVAVYKSQCSLSRMILSMRRISAVEKLHPLCITRSLMEPITCVSEETPTQKQTKKGINIVLNEPRCRSFVYPHLIFLVDFGSQDQGGERDASQVFWLSLKDTREVQDLVGEFKFSQKQRPSTLTVDSRRLRMQTPRAEVSGQNWKSRLISPSQRIISRCCAEEMFVP